MSTILNEVQQEQLNTALYYYLQKHYPSTANQFKKECQLLKVSENESSNSLDSSRLEMKWGLILKMQKQKLDLENQVKQLQDQIEKYESGDIYKERKKGSSYFIPKQIQKVLHGHKSQVTSLAFHPKTPTLASASEDCSIRLWDYETGDIEHVLQRHLGVVNSLDFNQEGDLLASCGSDLSVRIWSAESGWEMTRILNGHEHVVSCVRFVGPNDKHVASASRDGTIKIWEVSSGFCLQTLRGHDSWIRSIDVASNGATLVSAGNDRTIRIWNLFNGQCTKVIHAHDHNIEFVYFSPSVVNQTIRDSHGISVSKQITLDGEMELDGQFILSGSRDKLVKIWSTQNGDLVCSLKGHNNWVRDAFWHPNGTHILSCSDDKSIRVWDLRTALQVRVIENAHKHFISSIKICKIQDSIIATGCVDNQIAIWKCG